jgi:1-acyl-sn-glycerol-3-phosphate acyltransferase
MLWYRIARRICRGFLWVLYRFHSSGIENIPRKGGFVLASNHASYYDPVLLASANTVRQVHFMAKEELFKVPLFGRLILSLGALPIKRGGADRNLFRTFGELLKTRDIALVVFPEGTRTADGTLGSAKRGVGALCLAAGVPVIPAFIRGSYEVWPRFRKLPRLRGDIEVRFGPPIQWSDGEFDASGDANRALADLILKKIEELNMTEGKTLGFQETNRTNLKKGEQTAQGIRQDGPDSAVEDHRAS